MAYIKYKELTQYFNFYKELNLDLLPTYVTDYFEEGEVPYIAYGTTRDKFVLTDRKIILFDVRGITGKCKRIHFFPFISISSTALEFKPNQVAILLSMDSGYQLRLNFVKMLAEDKTKIRSIYMHLIHCISEKNDIWQIKNNMIY